MAADDEAVIPLRELLPRQRSALRVEATYAGSAVEGAIALDPALRQRRVWHSGRFYRVTPSPAPDGSLLVQAAPIRIRRVVRLRLRRMAGRDGA